MATTTTALTSEYLATTFVENVLNVTTDNIKLKLDKLDANTSQSDLLKLQADMQVWQMQNEVCSTTLRIMGELVKNTVGNMGR